MPARLSSLPSVLRDRGRPARASCPDGGPGGVVVSADRTAGTFDLVKRADDAHRARTDHSVALDMLAAAIRRSRTDGLSWERIAGLTNQSVARCRALAGRTS